MFTNIIACCCQHFCCPLHPDPLPRWTTSSLRTTPPTDQLWAATVCRRPSLSTTLRREREMPQGWVSLKGRNWENTATFLAKIGKLWVFYLPKMGHFGQKIGKIGILPAKIVKHSNFTGTSWNRQIEKVRSSGILVTRTGEAVRFHWQKGETEEFGETFFFLLAQMAYKNILCCPSWTSVY